MSGVKVNLRFPFADRITSVFIASQEQAVYLGFPEAGHWVRKGDFWELKQALSPTYEYDDSKCRECQGWGTPKGCPVCGVACMGG